MSAALHRIAESGFGKRLLCGRTHASIILVVSAALEAGAGVLLVLWIGGWQRFIDQLHFRNLPWVAFCLGAQLVAYAGYTLAFREVAAVDGGPRVSLGASAAVVAAGFSPIFTADPLGGFSVDRAALQELGLDEDEARVRVLTLNEFEYAVLAPAACVSAVLLLLHVGGRVPGSLTWPWLLVVPGIIGAGILTREGPRRALTRNPTTRVRRAAAHLVRSLVLMRTIIQHPLRHGLGVVGAGLYWAGDIAVLWACLHVFGIGLPLPALVLAFATGYALTRRALPAGGPGAVELMLPLALRWFHAPFAPAVVATFVYRFFTFWLALLPGFIVRRRLERGQVVLAEPEPD